MIVNRYVVVLIRADGSVEVMPNGMFVTMGECKPMMDWCKAHYLGVQVQIATCTIPVNEDSTVHPDEVIKAEEPTKSDAKRLSRKSSKTPLLDKEPDGWSIWCDVNKAAGRFEPIPSGPDVEASKRVWKLLNQDIAIVTKCFKAYLKETDKFIISNGFALRHIESKINKFLNPEVPGEKPVCMDYMSGDFDIRKVKIV